MIANQTLISRMNIWHIPDRIAFSEKPRKKRSIGKCNPTEVTHKINKRTCKVCDLLSSPLMYHCGTGCVRSVKDCSKCIGFTLFLYLTNNNVLIAELLLILLSYYSFNFYRFTINIILKKIKFNNISF